MSTLDNIAISTIGYVCNSSFLPVTRGTHGYICPGDAPPDPERPRRGAGGHGAVTRYPDRRPVDDFTDEELALLAVMVIQEGFD